MVAVPAVQERFQEAALPNCGLMNHRVSAIDRHGVNGTYQRHRLWSQARRVSDMARKAEGTRAHRSDLRREEQPSTDRGRVTPVGLSIEQAAEALGVSRSYMYQLIGAGAIATARIGRRRLIARATLAAYLRAQEQSEQEVHHAE